MWTDLRDVDPGVLGGLVVEYATRARDRQYNERWERDNHVFWAVREAQVDVAQGKRPKTTCHEIPSWLVRNLVKRLADREVHWLGTDFLDVRMLELAGLLQLEVDETYVMAMLSGLLSEWSHHTRTPGDPVAWFRQDPGLIERAYWKAFEYEGDARVSIRVGLDPSDWRHATSRMIMAGMITRDAVIDNCLAALQRDFSSTAARWFSTTLTDLELSTGELAARQDQVRRLLAPTQPLATVTLGVRWIGALDGAGLLDDAAAAPALRTAVMARTKVAAMTALKLLAAMHHRDASTDVVTAARAGLGHTHADVQLASARLLISAGAEQVVRSEIDLLEPSVVQKLGLEQASTDVPLVGDGECHLPPPRALPALRPVSDADLVERLAAVLERPEDPVEIELVLSALAGAGTAVSLEPLKKRALSILKRGHGGDYEGHDWLAGHIAHLIMVGDHPPSDLQQPKGPGSLFLAARLAEVEKILGGRAVPRRLLATPDDPAGWVDPGRFVYELVHGPPPTRRDLIAALLRLSPDGRVEALDAWPGSAEPPSETRLAVRRALGAEEAQAEDVQDAALWVAASRARDPHAEDPLLISVGLDGAGQGRGVECTVTTSQRHQKKSIFGYPLADEVVHEFNITVAHACTPASFSRSSRRSWWTTSKRRDPDQPTATTDVLALFGDFVEDDPVEEFWAGWHSMLWPHHTDHFLLGAMHSVHWMALGIGTFTTFDTVFRALARHPGRIGPVTAAAVALGLSANTVAARIAAVDALIDLHARGRMAAPLLALGMCSVIYDAKPTRWAESLRLVASSGAAPLVIDVLTRVLPDLSPSRRGVNELLDVLLQEQIRVRGVVVDPKLTAYLDSVKGSGKAALAARGLLALRG